jgi:hypothetical protein
MTETKNEEKKSKKLKEWGLKWKNRTNKKL